jgi:hypothetical protein
MSDNRRRYPRAKLRWPIVIKNNRGTIVGETKNIGVDGAFLFCPEPLKKREALKLFIMAPDRRALEILARVVWSNQYGSEEDVPPLGMGVRFEGISDEDRDFVSSLVSDHLKNKASTGERKKNQGNNHKLQPWNQRLKDVPLKG